MPYLNKHQVITLFWGQVVFQEDKMFQGYSSQTNMNLKPYNFTP